MTAFGATGRMLGTSRHFAASSDTRAHGALSLLMLSTLIVPINPPSLSIGTMMNVRVPPRSARATIVGSPSRYGSGPGTRLSNDADDHRAEWGLSAVCPLLTRARASPPLELLVHPDLDGVRLEKVMRRLALLLVGDVADDDRDHELALVGPISG
jgi:hypothetical protein